MSDTQIPESIEIEDAEYVPSRQERRIIARAEARAIRRSAPRRGPSMRTMFVAGSVAVSSLALAATANGIKNWWPSGPSIEPNPGQELGETTFSGAEVAAFRVTGVDAVGTAELTVDTITQQIIDKREKGDTKDNPHETLVFRDGKFGLRWENPGTWTPESTDDGILITLPSITTDDKVEVIRAAKIDEDATGRAFWQGMAGSLPGVSDTQASDFSDAIHHNAAAIESDISIVGDHMNATACSALASASQKATTIASAFDIDADIKTYAPPRVQSEPVDSRSANGHNIRNIRFRIADPTAPDTFLSMDDCLETLDAISFNTGALATPAEPIFGLLPVRVVERTLPAREQ